MKLNYTYKGSVKLYEKVIETNWTGHTMAESPKKAKSNLAYQFKKRNGLQPYVQITLPDALIMTD